jgi:hypothetical protein
MWGSVMHKTAAAVTAASTAFPPARNTPIASSVASGEDVAAAPFSEWTVDRPGNWKLRIALFSVAPELGDSKVAVRPVKGPKIGRCQAGRDCPKSVARPRSGAAPQSLYLT